jgi:integrase/recombinase XerD
MDQPSTELTPAAPQALPATPHPDPDPLAQLWLHGRPAATRRAYAADLAGCLAYIGKPLRQLSLADLQAYQDSLAGLSSASQARKLSAVKSCLSFCHRTGLLPLNVGAPLRPPPVRQTLAQRILDEAAVQRLLALEPDPRNAALLRLLYLGGLRISEICQLRGRDLQARDDAGQVTIFGKGGRTRAVLLKPSIWQALLQLRTPDPETPDPEAPDPETPVFRSRQGGGPLDPSQVHRIVKAAARRAGLPAAVSAHWLRHAHVSHALDHGAPAHLVQQTVGHASLTTTSRYAHARPADSSARYLAG